MTPAQKLRTIADSMGLDGYAESIREIANDLEQAPAPAVPQGAEMPLSMNQFGRLVELTREHLSDNTFVFKATSTTGDTCHFGVESAAKAWAKGGTVEAIKVREFKLHTTPAAPSQPVTLTDDEIKRNWSGGACPPWGIKFARAIIAALREKEGK